MNETPQLAPQDSVRELLVSFPQAAAVFERHGLLGCGGQSGPDERLDLFAAVHRVPLEALLAELREAIGAPPARPDAIPAAEAQAATLYRRFVRAALVCTLTLGATFGAFNLLVIHLGAGRLPAEHNWVHASFQIFGFVLLFMMGVAYHAIPRFLGTPLRHAWAAKASFGLALAGLVLRAYGELGELLPGTPPALLAGAVLQLSALLCLAGVLASTYRAARPALEPFHCYLAAGLFWWLAAGGLLVVEGILAVRAGDPAAGQLLHEPLYLAALFGATLPFIEGFLLRTGSAFLNLPPPRRSGVLAAFWLGQGGSALAVIGAGPLAGDIGSRLFDAGLLLLALSIGTFTLSTSVLRARAGHAGDKDPSFFLIVRQAIAWALVAAALAVLYGALDLARATPPSLLFDGLRHAFALGFVTLMIFGMGGRIIPIFGGTALRWPALRTAGAFLVSGGVLMRELEIVASVTTPWLLHVSACSGLVAGTGVALASASLLATLGRAETAEEPGAPVIIEPEANVHALVTAHPEALPVLIRAGFTQLANPIARQTLARAVSLRQACAMHGKDVAALAAQIREACERDHLPPPKAVPSPPRGELRKEPAAPAPIATGGPLESAALLDLLHQVVDPELGLDIVELGLVYGVDVSPPGQVRVQMTLTSPHCPAGEGMAARVDQVLRALPGVEAVDVDLTFDPPWSPARMSASARSALGLA
ncbi:MAG: iron-sulfur cluster assembly protein [Myxococcales bacterium]